MRWFGEPWPSPERRAPVCEDDAKRMEVPAGEPCSGQCGRLIETSDRGVAIPFLTGGPNWTPIQMDETYFHAKCFLRMVVGEKVAELAMPYEH